MARDASEEESVRASTPSQWRGSVRNATVGGTGSPDPVSTHRDFSPNVRRGWTGPVILVHIVVPESQCVRRSVGAGWAAGPAICVVKWQPT